MAHWSLREREASPRPGDPGKLAGLWAEDDPEHMAERSRQGLTYTGYLCSLMQWRSQLDAVRPYLSDEGRALLEELDYLLELSRLAQSGQALQELVCWDNATAHIGVSAVARIRYCLDCLADAEEAERGGEQDGKAQH